MTDQPDRNVQPVPDLADVPMKPVPGPHEETEAGDPPGEDLTLPTG